jgi:HSP20 family molecular chaperone IbpA
VAALLHDVVDDTSTTLDDVAAAFGTEVASLVDGVLRVAVPKAAPVSVGVKVEATPLPEDLPEPRAQVALALPGLGAADVTVTITRDRALLLHVRGDSAAFGSVHEVLRLPERAVVEQARAAASSK